MQTFVLFEGADDDDDDKDLPQCEDWYNGYLNPGGSRTTIYELMVKEKTRVSHWIMWIQPLTKDP